MSKYITEDDIPLGYSSEPDEYDSEHVQDLLLTADPCEIYVGNTGKVSFEKFFSLFKPHGIIKEMYFWRTHDHLYHARIVYRSQDQSDKAVKLMNNRKVFSKRLRVTYAKDRVDLEFPAAIRIDDISADVTEEDIFEHFLSCGDIRFVIKTGYAAYIQFAAASSAAQALGLEMILNGDPYTLTRISADDRIDHIQLIENMKDIKYRKPFVMVENYPELPKGTPLCRYKSSFESIGTVRHFKIAPTPGGTVTLALCMDKPEHRESVINRFNGAVVSDKRLKLYMAPGKARMTNHHVKQYAVTQNSITVDGIRPYFNDYDVCMLFRKCGSISFLERIGYTWTICFDNPSAVSLARSYHIFSVFNRLLAVKELVPAHVPGEMSEKDAGTNTKLPESGKKAPNKPKTADEYMRHIARKMDEDIKKNISKITIDATLTTTTTVSQKLAANQAKQIGALFKSRDSLSNVKATPVTKSKPAASQPEKRPAQDHKVDALSAGGPQTSTNDADPSEDERKLLSTRFLIKMSNLPKGIEENDLRELFRNHEIASVSMYCSKDLYYPTPVAYVKLTKKPDVKAVLQHHHDLYRGKRVCIKHIQQMGWEFLPERSVMLKNLPRHVTEEGILEELVTLKLKVVDILKPAHHYAYVDFTEDVKVNYALLLWLQNALTRFKIDVLPLYQSLPKTWMFNRSYEIRPIEKVRALSGALLKENATDENREFGIHNAHKLFIGNIPRDTQAEDVINYFNNFGSVIDYAPIEKKSCYLRKSAIMSFMNSKHAQNAYCQQPHFLEGSTLDVHLMDTPPAQYTEDVHLKLLTVKFHSPFLTNDEIRHALQGVVTVQHQMRFDAFDDRANYVASFKAKNVDVESLSERRFINDEAVTIVQGYDPTPPTDKEAREKRNIADSPHRQRKEKYLSYTVYKENLKDDMEVRSKLNKETDIPFKSFHNDNSVQINNVSPDTCLEDLRDLFVKCGDIVDYRALLLEEDATKICFVKFKIDLAADLACTYNQRMVNGKRILVHLAKETLVAERDRSLLVERLNPATTTEEIHEAFTAIGMVKYVQKQSPYSAIVCFKDKDSMPEAVNVTTIPNSRSFIVNPCYEEYDPRLFNNFSCQEEFIPIERMRAALKPRILPEFHQLELDRQMFEFLPDDIKSRLINEVFLAREQVPNFDQLSKLEQIDALKTKYQNFTHKEHFLRLNPRAQVKLLDVTSNLQQDYPYEEVIDLEELPSAPKRTRNEEPVNKKPDKAFAANWYSDAAEEIPPTADPHSSDAGPLQKTAPLDTAMNASHVAQMFPPSGLLSFPGNNGSPFDMGPQSDRAFPQAARGDPNMYRQPDRSQFAHGMPPLGGPHRSPMMQPGPGPMMQSPGVRWGQQDLASMAYNATPGPRGPMNFGGSNMPPYFN